MPRITALLDANILFSPPLRDLLIELSCEQVIHVRWTEKIHEEWIRAASKLRPLIPIDVQHQIRNLLYESIPDCLITDYEHLIDEITLPDENDRHVLAAAIDGNCNIIITRNIRDFPKKRLRHWNIEAQEPHTFMKMLDQDKILRCAGNIKTRLKDITSERYIQAMKKNRLKSIAIQLENSSNF
ncbi:MAG: PIN domain-containing protein [Methyloligellaceae bacterium]